MIDRPEDWTSTSVVTTLALGGEGINMNGHCDPASIEYPFGTLPVRPLVAALVCSAVALDTFPILLRSGTASNYLQLLVRNDCERENRRINFEQNCQVK